MRYLVAVCAYREGNGGGEARTHQLAVLDEARGRHCRTHGGRCVYVHPVQGVSEPVHQMEGEKQVRESPNSFSESTF